MKRNIKNIKKLNSLKKDLSELQRMSNENMNKIDSIILKFEEIVRNMKGVTMEQDIEILEELLNAKITFTISPTDYGWKALEHLIKAYKELEEENENEFKRGFFTKVAENKANTLKIESQVIPKSLIKETIEELGNMTLLTVAQRQEVSYAIAVLQELLEKRK